MEMIIDFPGSARVNTHFGGFDVPAEQCAIKKHFEHPPTIRVDGMLAS